jgi:hypothetical protein
MYQTSSDYYMLSVLNMDKLNYWIIFKWLLNAVVIHITWMCIEF